MEQPLSITRSLIKQLSKTGGDRIGGLVGILTDNVVEEQTEEPHFAYTASLAARVRIFNDTAFVMERQDIAWIRIFMRGNDLRAGGEEEARKVWDVPAQNSLPATI